MQAALLSTGGCGVTTAARDHKRGSTLRAQRGRRMARRARAVWCVDVLLVRDCRRRDRQRRGAARERARAWRRAASPSSRGGVCAGLGARAGPCRRLAQSGVVVRRAAASCWLGKGGQLAARGAGGGQRQPGAWGCVRGWWSCRRPVRRRDGVAGRLGDGGGDGRAGDDGGAEAWRVGERRRRRRREDGGGRERVGERDGGRGAASAARRGRRAARAGNAVDVADGRHEGDGRSTCGTSARRRVGGSGARSSRRKEEEEVGRWRARDACAAA